MDLKDQQQLRTIVREEMKFALKEIGLHDDEAGDDVRDLRSLDNRLARYEKNSMEYDCPRRNGFCFGFAHARCVEQVWWQRQP
jgi:hypothetical protein